MKRNASAHWQGDIKEGKGTISTGSGALSDQPYGFSARFEDGIGTNPEELLGGAHAGCFSMALSMILGKAGFTPDWIHTDASVNLEEHDGGLTITGVQLEVKAKVPDLDRKDFQKYADEAGKGCPVSKLFNAEITLNATLED